VTPEPVSFYGPGLRLELLGHPSGRCLLQAWVTESPPAKWVLEVLFQPVEPSGLARGFPTLLHSTPVQFSTAISDLPTAFIWLPNGFLFDLARRCYYRFSPVKSNPRSGTSHGEDQ
jgi:hypothetical protein